MTADKQILFIYDDRIRPEKAIVGVVGESTFGEILNKRERLVDKFKNIIFGFKDILINDFIVLNREEDYLKLKDRLFLNKDKNLSIIHVMSYGVIVKPDNLLLALRKSTFSDELLINDNVKPFMFFFPNVGVYSRSLGKFSLEMLQSEDSNWYDEKVLKPNDGVKNISDFSNFLQFFSGGFEARYFNSLQGDSYTLTKTSTDKKKIEKEHDLYQLLPNEIKNWFVAPYNLTLTDHNASYTMERLNIPDMALQWIHFAVSPQDLNEFLSKIFFFVSSRPAENVNEDKFMERFNSLYLRKVDERISTLKDLPEFEVIKKLIQLGTNFNSIDEIFGLYKQLYERLIFNQKHHYSVIGHGDLCFSNILYDKNTSIMRFIDPKGASNEAEMWTDPYYDVAKLSHSIFGNYDFINNEMFTININTDMQTVLKIDMKDLSKHKAIFYKQLQQNGFEVYLVRLCEASLFLSMLPLHIDKPQKVLAFILNAITILEELNSNEQY
ncbi:hypothetical protein WGM54_12615 [Paenibacillus polymyxa]|uniref:hypothetical protein n=1 Tax=Paenibacillus polymyxa TaxID=1406 RepID=UPI00307F8B6F